MTAGSGAATAGPGPGPDAAPGRPDGEAADATEGCCCLIAGYTRRAGLIADVTAQTEQLVALSPVLGDFLELRFVDLGPEPGSTGDRLRPVQRIAAALGGWPGAAGRNHFALLVIDKSAAAVEALLSSCAADPFLAGLRIRLTGIASQEDRDAGPDGGDGRRADIVCSPSGSWERESQLVDALYRQCEALLRYFPASGQPGLTTAGFTALKQTHQLAVLADPEDAGPDHAPVPDVLSGSADGAAGRAPDRVVRGWLARVPWYRRIRAVPDGAGQPAGSAPPAPRATGLVTLLVAADPDAAEDPAFAQLRAVPWAVDRRLAAQRACSYGVRLVYGDESGLRGELTAAGQLTRRGARRVVRARDFGVLFKGLRAVLRRDSGLADAAAADGLAVVRPAVVICTADPPMADGMTALAFGDLAAEAAVVWVVPKDSQNLVSPAFRNVAGVAVVQEHQAVAEDIWEVLRRVVAVSPASPQVGR